MGKWIYSLVRYKRINVYRFWGFTHFLALMMIHRLLAFDSSLEPYLLLPHFEDGNIPQSLSQEIR